MVMLGYLSHPGEARLPSICLRFLICGIVLLTQWAWSAEHTPQQLLDDVLQAHVVDGKVDYPGIAADPKFTQYLQQLEAKPVFKSRQDALAYWINAYNALAIQGILDGRSPQTVFGRLGYFKNTKYAVGGRKINLYDLEREVIIPLGEPRIHFAINCASASCPKLFPTVYTADKLETQLETSARTFINDSTRNAFDRDKNVAYLSKIFHWFEEDFRQHAGSVQKYVARYVDDPALAQALANESYVVKYAKYDWSLNGIPPRGDE
jgi:hypothetical protein